MSDNKPTRLASYCKERRLLIGLSIVVLAERVGCKPNKIVRFEQTGRIADEHLERLAEALNIQQLELQDIIVADCFDRLERMKEQRERRRQQRARGEKPYPVRTLFSVYRDDNDSVGDG